MVIVSQLLCVGDSATVLLNQTVSAVAYRLHTTYANGQLTDRDEAMNHFKPLQQTVKVVTQQTDVTLPPLTSDFS